MMVPEIWREQNRGGKKKNEREQNHIASPTGIANEQNDLRITTHKQKRKAKESEK